MALSEHDGQMEALTAWFEGFADGVPSKLYRRLARDVLEAPDVIAQLLEAHRAQQLPMLLFAAVHAEVLARGIEYPQDGEAFIAFCREHADDLRPVIRTRATQTNEVGRCAYLRPCIAAAADGRPLALIEVGASAGLNLNLDRYAYDFGATANGTSALTITTELRAGTPPLTLPEVGWRIGIDLAPAPDPDWLRACVFPDQPERLARLDAALAIAAQHPPPLLEGDAIEMLPQVLEQVPDGMQPVVFHTAVIYYLAEEQRDQLRALASQVTHVAAEEGRPEGGFALEVDGRELGRAHPHGRWLSWTG
jgi:hypothetical protein